MNNSSQELKLVSKIEGQKVAGRQALEELFNPANEPSAHGVSEEIKRYLAEECQKEIKHFLEQSAKEHEMSMKERQAGVNTSRAVTGVIVTWAVVGITMLARSCINFDKGPKFKV